MRAGLRRRTRPDWRVLEAHFAWSRNNARQSPQCRTVRSWEKKGCPGSNPQDPGSQRIEKGHSKGAPATAVRFVGAILSLFNPPNMGDMSAPVHQHENASCIKAVLFPPLATLWLRGERIVKV